MVFRIASRTLSFSSRRIITRTINVAAAANTTTNMSTDAAQSQPQPLARYRLLAPACGLRVSPLALGAMSIGQAWKGDLGSMTKEESFKLLDAYVERGGNFIDTACVTTSLWKC